MADKEPMLFRYEGFGLFRVLTGEAEDFSKTLKPGQLVKGEFVIPRGNTRRLAWYWIMLKMASEQLSDAVEGILSRKALHRWFKRETGLATPITSKKTGEIIDYDYESISFATMPEHERAGYVDQVSEMLARRMGVNVTTLREEAESRAA